MPFFRLIYTFSYSAHINVERKQANKPGFCVNLCDTSVTAKAFTPYINPLCFFGLYPMFLLFISDI